MPTDGTDVKVPALNLCVCVCVCVYVRRTVLHYAVSVVLVW